MSGPTQCRNHTLDLILLHGIDVNGVDILQQSGDISDHYLALCKRHIAKAVNSTPRYKYCRTITSTTKDCFLRNLPELSPFLSISNSAEKLDDVSETVDSLFSRTLDMLLEVIDPLLAINNSSLSLGYVPKTFQLAVIKPLIKKHNLTPKI